MSHSVVPVRKVTVYLPLQRLPSPSKPFLTNGATQVFCEAGETPCVVSTAVTPGHGVAVACTLTGREIAVP